jgi:hypothetical protein
MNLLGILTSGNRFIQRILTIWATLLSSWLAICSTFVFVSPETLTALRSDLGLHLTFPLLSHHTHLATPFINSNHYVVTSIKMM